ncbi:MAG: glycosyltransferase family 2 protein [Bacteroidota bacterium]
MVSVLIPTYNYNIVPLVSKLHQQLLHEQIDFEIIVLDDGSTNSKVTQQNKRITNFEQCQHICLQENIGRTAARNWLAEKATYNYLLFLDADVIPKSSSFIKNFDIPHAKADLVFGGISYAEFLPDDNKILRWKYGRAREAKPVEARQKQPHLTVISQCFLIKKEVFKKVNTTLDNRYGLDVLFTYNLKKKNTNVLHINNPIVHFGLEESAVFLEKAKQAVESIVYFEKKGIIPTNFRPIQQAYLKLNRFSLPPIFSFAMKLFSKPIEKNLLSTNPSLLLFDLYRLQYYIQCQKN